MKEYIKIGFARDLKTPKDKRLFRFLEILPGALSWGTLLLMIFLSWEKPVWVAFFIIAFDIYWILKLIFLAFHQQFTYRRMKENLKIDWLQKLNELPIKNWSGIYHLIILPFYEEELKVVQSTFRALVSSKYPFDKFIIVLGVEERAGEQALKTAEEIKKEFGDKFFKFLITIHPDGIEGELKGKGANETWAARQAKEMIDELKIPYENVIVSSFDIDTQVYPYYWARLTHAYLSCPDPLHSSFQPVPMYNNNIWDAPAISRVIAMGATFWHMVQQERSERMSTFSSHSMGFKALVEMDFWTTKNVSEDSRIYWQSLLFYDGHYYNVPLYYPLSMDANLAGTFWQTVKNVFKQQTRWSWGVENVPYFTFGCIKNKAMALRKKIYHMFYHWEAFWSWATNSLLIFMLGWLPLILGGEAFNRTLISYNLPRLTRSLMTVAMLGLFLSAFYTLKLLPPRPEKYKSRKYIWMIIQWILVPIATIIFGSIPALISQTRLMFGKYMGFWVTEKKRKE
ncbi:glycosyltransferase family 2 protein [Patescibacteria group bacterium]|nr:glycosyltransferase family 2 protein [Patescibacteria group bacterium]MBU4458667.1 glycosyltransferase family 2 protein [Patescibacteria group bacterium]MCG2696026.1 glycosyltransferase family 2 protein [Candidatus Portnoybacteria bacterium]